MIYYKCETCGSEWNGTKMLDICPFCDTKIAIQMSNFTNIDDALAYVFNIHGIEVINENNSLVALLSDYAPTLERERKLIRLALNTGVYSDLISVSKNDVAAQDLSVHKAISKLHNDAFMDPAIAEEIIEWFVKHLAWKSKTSVQEKVSMPNLIKNENIEKVKQVITSNSRILNVGNIIEFGKYPFEENGSIKPIEWTIMDIKDDKALLWSNYCVDAHQFASENLNSSWEYSSLRQWLREKFMKDAFTDYESLYIISTSIDDYNRRSYGSQTTDKVFIPSNKDFDYYKLRTGDLIIKATPYAKVKGVVSDNAGAFWWIRTPGRSEGTQMLVSKLGVVNESGSYAYLKNRGVRPAMWVDCKVLNNLIEK